jgi:hypothetical protein
VADRVAAVERGEPVFMSMDNVLEPGFHEWNWLDEVDECWRLFDSIETVLVQ